MTAAFSGRSVVANTDLIMLLRKGELKRICYATIFPKTCNWKRQFSNHNSIL